jgi:hypothetical protein
MSLIATVMEKNELLHFEVFLYMGNLLHFIIVCLLFTLSKHREHNHIHNEI